MTQTISQLLKNLQLEDADLRYSAFQELIKATDKPVDWIYSVWEELFGLLKDKNNHRRAIGAQLISNLAKSDVQDKLLTDFDKLYEVTYDEKFVTARHALQSLFKIGVVKPAFQQLITEKLATRFKNAMQEKNGTLIRYDIIEVFRKIYDITPDEQVKQQALALIETEDDLKYRKKYATLWKGLK